MDIARHRVNNRLQSAADSPASALADDAVPQAKNAARTRARILTAAQSVFAIHGYTHGGMREIAAEASVNVALVARYFGSKEKLFAEALAASIVTTHLWERPKATFGRSVVSMFVDDQDEALNPLRMLMNAAADPVARDVALTLIHTQIVLPLSEWLGAPDGEARAAQILALCAGFFTYRIMLPLEHFSGSLEPGTRVWLEESLQAVVDGHPRSA